MRYLAICLLIISTSINAQTTFKNLQEYQQKNLTFMADHFSTRDLQPLEFKVPNRSFGEIDLQTNLKMMTPNQYNMGYPSTNLSDMNQLLLGTTLTNTVKLGRRNINTTYFFDVSGNLVNYETSFPIGKSKK